MLDLKTALPHFSLPDFNGKTWTERDFQDAPALLVVFICPHCPYVKHVRKAFAQFASEYEKKGLAVVGINSNDSIAFPDDDPAGMRREADEAGYAFPYLYDASQDVAKRFQAACTPDFFLFDRNRQLAYRGQFDDSRPSKDVPVTGTDLRAAADAVLAGKPAATAQRPSVGCNIKWKSGNEPAYFHA